jgi:hypothetical protein
LEVKLKIASNFGGEYNFPTKKKKKKSSNVNVDDTSSPTSDIPISKNSPKKTLES